MSAEALVKRVVDADPWGLKLSGFGLGELCSGRRHLSAEAAADAIANDVAITEEDLRKRVIALW